MEQAYACQLCGAACGPAYACAGCNCLYYCSRKHQSIHAQYGHTAGDCSRMQGQASRAGDLPVVALPKQLQTQHGMIAYLATLGCANPTAWLAACSSGPPEDQQEEDGVGDVQYTATPRLISISQWFDLWKLKEAHMVPSLQGQPTAAADSSHIQDWGSLYGVLGMPAASPAAVLLSPVVTLWYCLQHVLPRLGWPLPPVGDAIEVHYLGARYEADQLPLFLVLRQLLPHHHLDLHLVGPHLPQQLHGSHASLDLKGNDVATPAAAASTAWAQGSACITLWCGYYQDVVEEWTHATLQPDGQHQQQQQQRRHPEQQQGQLRSGTPSQQPHLVFAPNAGLPAYPSWVPTLQHLLAASPPHPVGAACSQTASSIAPVTGPQVPFLATDFNEEAAYQSCRMVEGLLGVEASMSPQLNPFRSPVAVAAGGTALPSCSNAVLFGWLPGSIGA